MKKYKLFLLGALFLRLFLAFGPYHPDLGNHLDWGIKFWQLGPKYFYENLFWQVSWANQPPGTMYLFALSRKIYEAIFGFTWWLNLNVKIFPSFLIPFLESKFYVFLIKVPSILADFGTAYLIFLILSKIKDKKIGKIASLVFLFNPVIWYNSAVWGQTDAIINFFCLWSVFLFWQKKPILGTYLYFLSLYFKGSLVLFLPVILIFLLKSEGRWWKKILVVLSVPVIFSYLSYPFVRWMTPIPWLYHLYKDRIFGHQGNMLTANAFNFWALLFGIDFTRDDLAMFGWWRLKTWGQALFLLGTVPVLLNFLKDKKPQIEKMFFVLALISMTSFVFLSNMHERYLYPVIPYLTMLIFVFVKLKTPFIFLCLIFLLNLYHLWYVPSLGGLSKIFTPFFIGLLSFFNISLLIFFLLSFFRFFRYKKL